MKHVTVIGLVLALCIPPAADAAPPRQAGVNAEIRREMAEARREIRTELAKARADLDTDNLSLGDSLRFGSDGRRKADRDQALPRAEITPLGDFLVDGESMAIDARQRQQLLAYRGQVIAIARDGIAIGETAALAAIDAVDRGIFSLLVGAMTGGIERRVERVLKETVGPGVARICGRLPTLLQTQQRLVADLPAFQPYATLEAKDIADCESEFRSQFASR